MKKFYFVRTIVFAGSLLLQLSFLCSQSHGEAGDVDLSFDPGSGVNGTVNAIAVQPDGKVIIGGLFTTVKGLVRASLARLNATGEGDPTFNAGTNVDQFVSAMVLLSDGKVIFTRDFYSLNGSSTRNVARLNSNGTLDTSFVPDTGTFAHGSGVTCVVVQPDGRLVLGGYFNERYVDDEGFIYYYKRSLLVRLNANGTTDATFTDGNGKYGGSISSVALQADGKILIGGSIYATVAGTNRFDVVRLNADGTLDESFEPGVSGFVLALAVQPDGKTFVGGNFIGNGTNRNAIVRLNANGSLDAGFDPSAGGIHAMRSFAVMPETGDLLVSGAFRESDNQVRTKIVRLHANGTLDNSLTTGTDSDALIALQSDGKLFIGGAFTKVNDLSRERIARLNIDGSLDTAFEPGASINGPVNAMLLQPDGNLLLRGQFTTINGTARNRIGRLLASGAVDASFDPGAGVSGGAYMLEISAITAQADGKLMIGGDFNSVSGTNRYRLARLNSNGAVDSGFISGIGGVGFDSSPIQSIAIVPDGRMLVAEPGGVDGLNPVKKIARLDSSGNVDNTFDPVIAPGLPGNYHTETTSLVVQPDGKILVAGRSLYDEFEYQAALLLRLNVDGSVDGDFERTDVAGPSSVTVISAVALQSDGKILIGGNFADIKGVSRNGIARLNVDGTLDGAFDPGSGVSGTYDPAVLAIHIQLDGRILIGGSFSNFNGTNHNNIARLNVDGSLDGNFNAGTGADNFVRSIALQQDGCVLIGGSFNTVNGVVRPYVARLHGDSVVSASPSLSITRSNFFAVISWSSSATGYSLQESTNISSTNSWFSVAQSTVTNAGQISVTIPTSGTKFFQLKSP